MKILLILVLFFLSNQSYSTNAPRLFCHGDGIRSSLFFWDGKQSNEFVDIEFSTPNYINSYLACTSFLFSLQNKDRQRKIKHKELLNSFQRNFSRFIDEDKAYFYSLCLKDFSCKVRFPYSLLEPRIFFSQLTSTKLKIPDLKDKKITDPTSIPFSHNKEDIRFWKLPEVDLIKEFWDVTSTGTPSKIYLSSMTYSINFLKDLAQKFKDKKTFITIYASFNMMALEENITEAIKDLPPNILFIPIFQTSQEPYSFHQKGAIVFNNQKSTLVWTSSNFRRYETNKLYDIGMTLEDSNLSKLLANRWSQTAYNSCFDSDSINFNLKLRFYNFPEEYVFWNNLVRNNCNKLTTSTSITLNSKPILKVVIDLITNAKYSIDLHSHVLGNSEIIQKLIEMEKRGIKIRLIGGKTTKFNFARPWVRYKRTDPQHHAKFIIIDNSFFVWGTGNFTKTSLSNQREDYFIGSQTQIIKQLLEYFEKSWKIAK
jgi:hypothetical protein